MEGKPVASFHKRVFTISDKWDVNITGNIDKRLIVFIPSFISSTQAERDNEDDEK